MSPVRIALVVLPCVLWGAAPALRVKTDSGELQGAAEGPVRIFKGIPYAAPPVGDLRWKEPRPAARWNGVRPAETFGARCAQPSLYSDMTFRDPGMSEDCLFLNVWTPAGARRAPVLVYFHGGGFGAGSGDEPRYDGGNFARMGIVAVTVNYRLGVFGFLAHPDLTSESPHHASGNYGMLDQTAALEWVRRNIAAFGGDPRRVTIAGESAGSFAVSALMASPVSRKLFQRAIGESGAMFSVGGGTLAALPAAVAQEAGVNVATILGAHTIAELRSSSAEDLLKVAALPGAPHFTPILDGYFLPESPGAIYSAGQQSSVPLLAGWNADEVRMGVLAANPKPTLEAFQTRLAALFGDQADAARKVYPAADDEEALRAAGDLASDQFIDYCTWKWIELHSQTGKSPVYRYRFDRPVPFAAGTPGPGVTGLAAHSWELEYVFQALASKKAAWQPEDRRTSGTMAAYFANFIKTGDPNGVGLPEWPAFNRTHAVMHLDAQSHAAPEEQRDRYLFIDQFFQTHH